MLVHRITLFFSLLVSCQSFIAPFSQPVQENTAACENDGTKFAKVTAAAFVAISTSPLIAIAEEIDDYEYGAVNAPIGLAWGAGVLAILTAAVPVLMQGGEDAFNEMREQDAEKWRTGSTYDLSKKKSSLYKGGPRLYLKMFLGRN